MAISAALVKELRTRTGAGIMDAKKALVETDGNIEGAIDWLRTKGIAKAAKKSGRTTGEGQIGVCVDGKTGILIEINSETDFVARNSSFCQFVKDISQHAVNYDDLESLLASSMGDGTVADALAAQISALGENLAISRMSRLTGNSIVSYVHNQAEPGIGKIGVLISLDGDNGEIGRQIAMHVAATNPIGLSEDDVPAERVARERQVLTDIANASGKPPAIVEKIVDGGLRKFFQTETLLNQKFVINPEISVKQAADEAGAKIVGYVVMKVGEGG